MGLNKRHLPNEVGVRVRFMLNAAPFLVMMSNKNATIENLHLFVISCEVNEKESGR